MRRIRQMGAAVGEFLAALEGERVLVVGSGGLSKVPLGPQSATASNQHRAMLLDGRNPTAEAREARRRVIDIAVSSEPGDAEIRDFSPP